VKVAVLGTGKMGTAAATRLAAQGFEVRLWNRTRERADAVGVGRVFETPAAAVDDTSVALSILTGPEAVREVYDQLDARGDRVYLEMSTAGPEVPEELARRFHRLVAAPVIAPPQVVEAGKALFIAGGPEDAIEEARPVFKALGEVRSVGTYRRAAAMKLMNNAMLAITAAAGAEMLEAGVRTGLTPEEAFEWVKRHAPYLEARKSGYLGGPYEPLTFSLKDMLKDVELALALFDGPDYRMPIVEAVRDAYQEVLPEYGDQELTAVLERYRGASGRAEARPSTADGGAKA
jgi:3-hydroxyisobutyrate dehydrogenase-like beta-hydroxyacid dehydrogenase